MHFGRAVGDVRDAARPSGRRAHGGALIRRTAATIAFAGVLVLLGVGVAPPALGAAALPSRGCGTSFPATNGKPFVNAFACFEANGDHVYAHDGSADGHHVEVFWSVDRYSGVCKNYDGFDPNDRKYDDGHDCNYDFAENSKVCMQAAAFEGNKLVGDFTERKCFSTS